MEYFNTYFFLKKIERLKIIPRFKAEILLIYGSHNSTIPLDNIKKISVINND